MGISYMGSKRKIAKTIVPLMIEKANLPNLKFWVEPFFGGANTLKAIPKDVHVIGSDINDYVIHLYNALKAGWLPPPSITEERYLELKTLAFGFPRGTREPNYLDAEIAFAGLKGSYGSSWFGGFARNYKGGVKPPDGKYKFLTRYEEGHDKLPAFAKDLQRVSASAKTFQHISEHSLKHDYGCDPSNTIIYCDIPYKDTAGYTTEFDHNQFWIWAQVMADCGYNVFVSEYSPSWSEETIVSPTEIWSLSVNSNMNATHAKKTVERLYHMVIPEQPSNQQ